MTLDNNISLAELAATEEMSIRAMGVCYNLGLDTLDKILQFYQRGGNFKSIRNCGERTENELIFICKKYLNGYQCLNLPPELPFIDKTIEIVNSFNPFKKAALNRHVDYLLSNLNPRARNGLISLYNKKPTTNELIEKINSKNFSFYGIRNIGEKSALELIQFKKNISDFVVSLQTINNSELSKEYTKLTIKTTFDKVPDNLDVLLLPVFDLNNKVKLFKLIDLLIECNLIFKKTEKEIFYHLFTKRNNKSLTEIANGLSIGKERARQIKVNLEAEIKNYFRFILNLQQEDVPNYGVDSQTTFLPVGDEFCNVVNQQEQVSFNPQFYSSMLALLLEKTHSIFGDDEVLSTKNKLSNSKRFFHCYLIQNELFYSFDFSLFTDSINEILNDKITEDYCLHFQGYISQFFKTKEKKNLELISKMCETILFNEFSLVVTADGCLIFERNKKKQMIDYVVEALEELGEMTRVEQIAKKINDKYVHLEINEQSVRATLQREKELFIFIGRSSTYGLRKWQEERDNLKGGTIRDIVEEYLQVENDPKHISEITSFVCKYRKTTKYNIKTNLELEDNGRFQFFPGEFIGLKSKQYVDTDKYKKAVGSYFRNAMFRKMNGWHIDDVINYFVNKFNYHHVHVKSIIEKKISQGDLSLSSDNKLIV